MKVFWKTTLLGFGSVLIPLLLPAQTNSGLTEQMQSLQEVLDKLYLQMIPLAGSLIGVGRGIAGFAALWYIGARVFRSMAKAEPIDVYPLFRPFVLGICILMFPAVLGIINGVMQPVVRGTAAMVHHSDKAIETLLENKTQALEKTSGWQMYMGTDGAGDQDRWYQYTHPDDPDSDEGLLEGIGDDIKFAMAKASYRFQNSIKAWMSEVLEVLFQAAALCINTLRTFNLIILAMMGPLVLGLSVFDGFGHSLQHWLARYLNVFLWLPVANIFGAMIAQIQENMLQIDISQIAQAGDTFFSPTDVAYLVFLIIAIFGYFSVPAVASHIVRAGGGMLSAGTSPVTTALGGGIMATMMRSGAANTTSVMTPHPGPPVSFSETPIHKEIPYGPP